MPIFERTSAEIETLGDTIAELSLLGRQNLSRDSNLVAHSLQPADPPGTSRGTEGVAQGS
jgi:hypothetical protein